MKTHRVRYVNHPEFDEDLIFVEMEEDGWLTLEKVPTHDAIHRHLDKEEKEGKWHLRFGDRWFVVDPILNEYKEEKING